MSESASSVAEVISIETARRPGKRARDATDNLEAQDRDNLRWYYATGGLGMALRSTTAAGIAVIEQSSRVAIPCVRCGGDPQKWIGGTGFVDSKTRRAAKPATEEQSMLLALLDIAAPSNPIPALMGDQLCPDCDGRCWQVGARKLRRSRSSIPPSSPFSPSHPPAQGAPDAWPTHGPEEDGGASIDDQHVSLAKLGRVSRQLARMREIDGTDLSGQVFDCYFSPDGGSVAALWHLTPAGVKMLRTNPAKLHHTQLFANLRAQQETDPKANRKALFDAADEQSGRFLERACENWLAANGRTPGETPAESHRRLFLVALQGGE